MEQTSKLNALMGQVKAAQEAKATKATLKDVLGKGVKVIQPLSPTPDEDARAFYVDLKQVNALDNGIEFLVVPEFETKEYVIRVNINNHPEMFVNNLTPLCGQLKIDVLTVEAFQSKVGQGFCVLAIRNGSFINYSFDMNRIAGWAQA